MWCNTGMDVICIQDFFLFWLVVMCLLSSLDKIDLPLELLAYDVWESKEYKTGVLSVSVKSFDQSCL